MVEVVVVVVVVVVAVADGMASKSKLIEAEKGRNEALRFSTQVE